MPLRGGFLTQRSCRAWFSPMAMAIVDGVRGHLESMHYLYRVGKLKCLFGREREAVAVTPETSAGHRRQITVGVGFDAVGFDAVGFDAGAAAIRKPRGGASQWAPELCAKCEPGCAAGTQIAPACCDAVTRTKP
jgi:hypothetical protein